MKKIGDLMKEMGFNASASDDAKKAFLKYLMKESEFHDRVTAIHKFQREGKSASEAIDAVDTTDEIKIGEQLSLFQDTGSD